MRNYFGFDLKGVKIVLPFLAGWGFMAAISVLYAWLMGAHASADPELDWRFFMVLLCSMLFFAVVQFAVLIVAYYFVKATVPAASLSGERFEAGYEIAPYMRLCLKGVLLTTVTFGIYFPWLAASIVRYFASETSFRCNFFEFRGKASMLFIYTALFLVAPLFVIGRVFAAIYGSVEEGMAGAVVLWLVLCLVLFLSVAVYRALALKWIMDFAYGGRKRIVSEAKGWHAGLFIFGQYILCIVTLGLYYPMSLLRIWRYYVSRLLLGGDTVEDRFGFSMRPWANYLTILGQMVLVVITAGIYYPWAYARIGRLLVSQTYMEVMEERSPAPMPSEE